MLQSNLFEQPVVAGLAFQADLIAREAEAALIARIDAVDLTPFRFQGWLGKRVTASFGWRYDFDNASFGPTEPIPDWLLPIRASAASFAGLAPDDLVQVLLTRYDPGAGIGWHRDRPGSSMSSAFHSASRPPCAFAGARRAGSTVRTCRSRHDRPIT